MSGFAQCEAPAAGLGTVAAPGASLRASAWGKWEGRCVAPSPREEFLVLWTRAITVGISRAYRRLCGVGSVGGVAGVVVGGGCGKMCCSFVYRRGRFLGRAVHED